MFSKVSLLKRLLDLDDSYITMRGLNENNDEEFLEDEDIDVDKTDKLFFECKNNKIKKPTDFRVKPVIKEEDDYLFISKELPKIPFSMLNCAHRGGGKTTTTLFLVNMLDCYFDNIIIFSPTIELDHQWKTLFDKLDRDFEFGKNIFRDYNEATLTKILVKIKRANKNKPFKDKVRTLMIFDDIISMLPKNKRRTNFNKLILNNRHYNISIIINSQSFKLFDSNLRKNCSQICLWRTDNVFELENYWKELAGLLGDTTRECRENFMKIYNYATRDKHSFLYLNYHNKPNCFFKNLDECIDIQKLIKSEPITFMDRLNEK